MVEEEIILAIVMETIQQQNVHHHPAHHSYQDSQVSYQAMEQKFYKDSLAREVEVAAAVAEEDLEVFLVITLVPW